MEIDIDYYSENAVSIEPDRSLENKVLVTGACGLVGVAAGLLTTFSHDSQKVMYEMSLYLGTIYVAALASTAFSSEKKEKKIQKIKDKTIFFASLVSGYLGAYFI